MLTLVEIDGVHTEAGRCPFEHLRERAAAGVSAQSARVCYAADHRD